MMQNTIMFSILAVIATVIVCFVVSTFLLKVLSENMFMLEFNKGSDRQ